ncbi:hypothetical protein MIMGU_mgv1a0128562mg, partial [Erythranthe guttata]
SCTNLMSFSRRI